jgi:hypothetical protein
MDGFTGQERNQNNVLSFELAVRNNYRKHQTANSKGPESSMTPSNSKLTSLQIIATVCFTFAVPAFANPPVYGIPTGSTISATSPDTTLVTWPKGDPLNPLNKPHLQIRADQTYTAQSDNLYPPGFKFDPHGKIGIQRYFQPRTHGTYSLGTPSSINVLTKDMPANSRFNQAQHIQDFGPYAPDQSTYTISSLAANDVYGVETIELVFIDGNNNLTVLDYQKIDIYEPTAPNANQAKSVAGFNVQNFKSQVALNTDTTKPYLGDPPRVTAWTTQTVYPGAKITVVIYPGPAQTTPPASAKTISSATWTAPPGDESKYPPNTYYMDIGSPYVTGSGTYTLQAMETTTAYGYETFGNPASFSIKTSYNVTSQLGLVK